MTYIRDPRCPFVWESDGIYNGKYMANDGTLHDSANEVLKYEKKVKDIKEKVNRGEVDFPFCEV